MKIFFIKYFHKYSYNSTRNYLKGIIQSNPLGTGLTFCLWEFITKNESTPLPSSLFVLSS